MAFAGAPVARGIDSGQGNSSTFTDKMRDWQEEMSQAFHDTWKDLWQNKSAKSLSGSLISTASMDLREQPDNYTVRLNLPNRNLDKVDVKITGGTLHIVAPAEGNASLYEQDVKLADVAADAKPVIERKQDENLIVVTVPKAGGQAAPAPREITSSDDWDRDVLDQMSRMQREMNQIFDN
jgi:HSP20 family molecular chaperone IbpA